MNSLQQLFLNEVTQQKEKNFQNIYTYMRKIDLPEEDICAWDMSQFEDAIIGSKPNSLQDVSSSIFAIEELIKWILKNKYSDNTRGLLEIERVNRQAVFYRSLEENGVEKKYISQQEYLNVIEEIQRNEVNDVYYQAILMAIYEGVYSDDLSVLMNLKDTDINNGIVSLRTHDGEEWDMSISNECERMLIRNARIQDFYIVAPYGGYRTEKVYVGYDGSINSCFKTALRVQSANRAKTCRQTYYRILRELDKYFGRHVKPKNIFISGVMHRASQKLNEKGYGINDVLTFGGDNKEAIGIVMNEFKRSHYNISIKGLRENMKGHIEEFG